MIRWTRRRTRHFSSVVIVLTAIVGVMLVSTSCGKKPKPPTNVTEQPTPPPTPPPAPPTPPPPPPVEKPAELMLTDVYFDYDKSNLREDARQSLEENAQMLQQNKNAKLLLEGHCDERGTVEYNLALGDRRAQSVKGFLVQYGIGGDRLETISYGKERPFAMGHDESAWSQNRRVHFNIKK